MIAGYCEIREEVERRGGSSEVVRAKVSGWRRIGAVLKGDGVPRRRVSGEGPVEVMVSDRKGHGCMILTHVWHFALVLRD